MDSTLDNALDILQGIIRAKCIIKSNQRWLVAATGRDNSWLIDMRQAFLDGEALEICATQFWNRFEALLPFQVGGLEIGAIPLVIAILLKARQRKLSVTGFIVRKERKPTGAGKMIEGDISPLPIVVVDDIMNSASTVEKVRSTLENIGRKIDHVFVIVDYGSAPGKLWSVANGIVPVSLFSLSDLGLQKGLTKTRVTQRFQNVWKYSSPNANHFHVVPKSSPAVFNGLVMFGSDRGTLWALDESSGEIAWSFQTIHRGRKGIWSRPCVSSGRVIFGGYDGNLYCLNASTGDEVWRNCDADSIGSSPAVDPERSRVWIGLEYSRETAKGSIAAFELDSGEKIFEYLMPQFVHGSPAFSGGLAAVAIGCNDSCLYLFDADNGDLKWRFSTHGAIKDAPTFDEKRGLVYVAGFDGMVRAIDVNSGLLVWALSTGNAIYSTPLIANDRLFVTSTDKKIHILDLHSCRVGDISIGSKSVSSPCFIQSSVFVGSNGGLIYEIDVDSLQVIGTHQLPEPMTNRIVYSETAKMFYGLTYMNQMFAFRRLEP